MEVRPKLHSECVLHAIFAMLHACSHASSMPSLPCYMHALIMQLESLLTNHDLFIDCLNKELLTDYDLFIDCLNKELLADYDLFIDCLNKELLPDYYLFIDCLNKELLTYY